MFADQDKARAHEKAIKKKKEREAKIARRIRG
jgi:hypothetical protein